ncbi:MAG TPA: polysaccharide biosynthesis/export family protein [Puia sp.]|nr:polysaccharide biosynthesis/export family protein [Puia sp.]
MKNVHGFSHLTFACLLLIYCTSCTTAKKLTIMQDLSPNQSVPGPKPPPIYHIRPKDNLYVGIATPDQDLTRMTDPTSNGVSLAMAYEGIASKAVNGNIVDPDGNITLPMLGKIPVAGLTTTEAEDTIRGVTKQYLKDATVKVRLLSYKVTVLGEVKLPGVYYNYNSYITVLDAISLAQGTTDYAKLADVLILRPTTGGTRTYSINLNSRSAVQSPAWYLQPDDVVVLQPGKNKGLQQKLPLVGIVVGALSAFLLLLNYLK